MIKYILGWEGQTSDYWLLATGRLSLLVDLNELILLVLAGFFSRLLVCSSHQKIKFVNLFGSWKMPSLSSFRLLGLEPHQTLVKSIVDLLDEGGTVGALDWDRHVCGESLE